MNLESAEFSTEPVGHEGVFLPPCNPSPTDSSTKVKIDIYSLEIWGVVPGPEQGSDEGGANAVQMQRAKWEFEAREAERRRNINIKAGAGGDSAKESARWLLETAGIISDHGQYDN